MEAGWQIRVPERVQMVAIGVLGQELADELAQSNNEIWWWSDFDHTLVLAGDGRLVSGPQVDRLLAVVGGTA